MYDDILVDQVVHDRSSVRRDDDEAGCNPTSWSTAEEEKEEGESRVCLWDLWQITKNLSKTWWKAVNFIWVAILSYFKLLENSIFPAE